MKRFTKLSLAAIVTLSTFATSANASDSIAEAFSNSKVKGELKAVYGKSNFDPGTQALPATKDDSILAAGGSLGIITDTFYGIKLGATFQASTILSDTNKNAIYANDMNVSGAVLSESYVDYTIANTNLKAGRQFITTPLLSSSLDGKASESLIKDSFEAYVLTNADIPDTTLIAGYVSKYQGKTNGTEDVSKFDKFQDGAYTIYAKNTSVENLTLQAQYLDENGITSTKDKNALYLQADYKMGAHTLSAQYLSSEDKTQAANAQDGTLYGLRAMGPIGIDKLGYIVAYNSSTDRNAPVYTGAGAGTTDTAFTAMPVNGGGVPTRADTDTLVGGVIIPIATTTSILYTGKSTSSTHALGDVTAIGAIFIYPVVKNFTIKANYEHVEIEKLATEDADTVRVYLSYKF